MAGGATNVVNAAFLDFFWRGLSWTLPSQWWLSLHTADPGESGAHEVTASEYARLSLGRATSSWDAPADESGGGKEVRLSTTLTWQSPTTNWGTITHVGVWDAASGGNFVWSFQLASPVTITAGGNPFQLTSGLVRAIHR